MSVDALGRMVNGDGGLAGISGTTGDMRTLLDRRATDPRAAEAVEVFCYQVSKAIAAMATALDGVDTIVFTGGIGEHAGVVRARVCERLTWLGVSLDETLNGANASVISRAEMPVTVRIMPTNEEVMIARHVRGLLRS